MHVVYKFCFKSRLELNTPPYYYIGLKTNCIIKENIIFDSKNKSYWSSSKNSIFYDCLKIELPQVEIIEQSDDLSFIINKEIEHLEKVDAKRNLEYFNLSNGINNPILYNCGYSLYKHYIFSDCRKILIKNDPLVLTGEYVGITKGYKYTRSEEIKNKMRGENNPFFGKQHSLETKKLLSEITKKQNLERPENFYHNFKISCIGRPTSDLQKQTARKTGIGKIVLKNPITMERKRILKNSEEYDKLISDGWYSSSKDFVTLKSPITGENKCVYINSEEHLLLLSEGWYGCNKNRCMLKNSITNEYKSVYINSEEYLLLISEGWISPHKGKITLKDPITKICKKVLKNSEECDKLISEGWMNPHKLKKRLENEKNCKD